METHQFHLWQLSPPKQAILMQWFARQMGHFLYATFKKCVCNGMETMP